MSYTLQIWKHPEGQARSRTAQDAVRCIDGLARSSVHGDFVDLAQQLTSRYRWIIQEDTDADGEASPWLDNPMGGASKAAVYVIGLHRGHIDEVRPFVVETAIGMGFDVLDEQTGEFFPAYGTPPKSSLDPNRLTERGVRDFAAASVKPIVEAAGFRQCEKTWRFEKLIDGGWQRIFIVTWDFGPEIWFSLCAQVRLHSIHERCARLLNSRAPRKTSANLA